MNDRHRFRSISLVVAVILCVLAGGCRTEQSVLVGKWTDAGGTMMMLNSDGTFSEGEGPNASSGKWAVSGFSVTLTVDAIGGKPIEEAIKNAPTSGPNAIPADELPKVQEEMKHMHFNLMPDRMSMDLQIPGRASDKFKRWDQ